MNWVRAIAAVLVLSSGTAWGATLTWTANGEADLAGYRVYQCSQQPCTRTSSNASLFVTLGTVTSFNIGTPAVTQYYIITAYDFGNNESSESNLAIFIPAGSPPPAVTPPPTDHASACHSTASRATGHRSKSDEPLLRCDTGRYQPWDSDLKHQEHGWRHT